MTPVPGQAAALIQRLRTAGVALQARGDRLTWSAPPGVMTPPLLDELRAAKAEVVAALQMEHEGWIPLAAAQERLYVTERLRPGRPDFNVPAAVRAKGDIDEAALGRALDALAGRHEALRLAFAVTGERPLQRVTASAHVPFEVREVPNEREALRMAAEEARRPFDLSVAPMVRTLVLRIDPSDRLLVFTFHHLICDEMSLRLALRDLMALYAEHAFARPAQLGWPARQYSDYVAADHASSGGWEEDLAFWRRELAGMPTARSARGVAGNAYAMGLDVPGEAAARLGALARAERSTLVCAVLAAFAVALAGRLRRDDVVVGMPSDDRRSSAFDDTVGTFVNTIAVRAAPAAAPTFRDGLRNVRRALLGSVAHAGVPYHRVVSAVRPRQGVGELFDAWLVVRRALPELSVEGVSLSRVDLELAVPRHDLKLDLQQGTEGLRGTLIGRSPAWEPHAVDELAASVAMTLTRAGEMADAPMAAFRAAVEADATRWLRRARARADESARARLKAARRARP